MILDIQTLSARLLIRNTLLNLLGQVTPLLVGIVTIPFVIREMGADRFGLLSLAWVILSYFAIFDLGLGRATTKYVAEALGKGNEDQIPCLLWTSVVTQTIVGFLGTLILVAITPLLVRSIFNIPLGLIGEAEAAFYLLSLLIPISLVSGSFFGVLEAAQRFDLVNAVRIPSNALIFLFPAIGLLLDLNLPGIIALILVARLGILFIIIAIDFYIIPQLRRFSFSFALFPMLFSFGGWVMISNMLAPFLRYLDRFLLGALVSVSAVAYYSISFDILERLWIIPSSLVLTLFPAFSVLCALNRYERAQKLFLQALKYLSILIAPLTFFLIAFAEPIFKTWLGVEIAKQSVLPFQILAFGALIGLLAPVAGSVIYGYGRPDIIGKLYLMYVPLNIGLVWLLVKNMGLSGAALSFLIRTILETMLLVIITSRLIHLSITLLLRDLYRLLGSGIIAACLMWLSTWLYQVVPQKIPIFLIIVISYCSVVYYWVFNREDRAVLQKLLRRKPSELF